MARAKHPYLSHTGRASNAEKQPTGPGPKGCDENGPAAALLVGHVSIQICSLLAPCRRPILIATIYLLFRGQDTSLAMVNIHTAYGVAADVATSRPYRGKTGRRAKEFTMKWQKRTRGKAICLLSRACDKISAGATPKPE